jgi:hypothetical protein
MIDNLKSKAVVLYLSVGSSAYPKKDPEALDREFGPEGAELRRYVKELLAEMYTIPIDWQVHSYQSGIDAVKVEMHARHPELSEDAIQALRWDLSYQWK